MLYENFVLTDDKFLQPCYRVSPFKEEDISKNKELVFSDNIDSYLSNRFNNKKYIYTLSGRGALNKALQQFNLKQDDIVTIFTTSGNLYISSCVTKEIEKFCEWSRKIESKTKILLVNHEFGFPYEDLSGLLDYNIPIIEDCAHTFISQNQEKSVGKLGDYVIYSLPKFFPIQFGGILLSNKNENINTDISTLEENYIKKVLSNYIPDFEEIIFRRIKNYKYLEQKLSELGFESRFTLKEDSYCPGVYMFKTKEIDLNELKIFLQTHGIECSVFYGEDAFFIPVNQKLELSDLDYFISVIKYFVG